MGAYPSKLIWFGLLIFLVGCKEKHFRPVSVPSSALRVDNTFIDCSVDIRSRANNCTVYKDDTGQILAEGLFVLGTSDKGVDKSDLRFAAFGEQGIYLENLGVLQQQTASERDPSHRVFDERLKAIASKNLSNALDCGEWAVTNEADTVSECALAAFTHRKPFYVRYYEPERAHFRYDGIACDSDGNFYGVSYLSGRTVQAGGAGKDGQMLVLPCPKPASLTKTRMGILTCFQELINGKPVN